MEPIDVWRSARLIVKLHGHRAPDEGRRRAAAFVHLGNAEGFIAWDAIGRAAAKLLEDDPPDDIT